jgi:acetoin utilization deacetylase AcuC-like enzyme
VTVAYLSHPDCARHMMGAGHPERPERLAAIADALNASGLMAQLVAHEAPTVTREALERAHDVAYLDRIEAVSPTSGLVPLDPDTAMNPWTLRAAQRAAGAGVRAVDLVMQGAVQRAFCNVRPPGHHAERHRAMGFCVYGNVAIAALHALDVHGLERVCIVDFDVHHGNGTEHIVRDDPRVLMVGTFQHPFYPYSGAETRSDRMVNVPLAAYSEGPHFRAMVEEFWGPAIERFAPQLFLISAGFDAHRDDEMAALGLVEADYGWVTQWLVRQADRFAHGRIVSMLEGGYHLPALGASAAAHVRALIGRD